jgi:hypothetical protein
MNYAIRCHRGGSKNVGLLSLVATTFIALVVGTHAAGQVVGRFTGVSDATVVAELLSWAPLNSHLAVVEVTHVVSEPISEKYDGLRARLRVVEVLLGKPIDGSFDLVDPGHRTLRAGAPASVGSFVPSTTPVPKVGDRWLLKWKTPSNGEVNAFKQSLVGIPEESSLTAILREVATHINHPSRAASLRYFSDRWKTSTLTNADRVAALSGALLVLASDGGWPEHSSDFAMVMRAVREVLDHERPTGELLRFAIKNLQVNTAKSQLSAEEVSNVRYLMARLLDIQDEDLVDWVANSLATMALRPIPGGGGKFAYFPEIEACLARLDEQTATQDTSTSRLRPNPGRAALNTLRLQRQRVQNNGREGDLLPVRLP